MIDLKDYIKESLKINKDSKLDEKFPSVNGSRNLPKDKIKKLKPDDEWSEKIFAAINDAFKNRYKIRQMWSGAIYLYSKNSRTPSMKNLVCGINSNAFIDFGPNKNIAQKLGEEIFNVIDSVN